MNKPRIDESASQRMANSEPTGRQSQWRIEEKSTSPPSVSLLPTPYSLLHLLLGHAGLLIALVVYLGLAFAYFFIVPIFESPDEWTHTGHINYIAEGNGLPVMLPGQGIWGGQQPPLYYALGALLIQPFELDNLDDYLKEAQNPHASLGYALDPGNKNNFLHTSAENFPYHGLSLTVHILRLYSLTYGLITLIFTYLTALELFNYQFRANEVPHTQGGPSGPTLGYAQGEAKRSVRRRSPKGRLRTGPRPTGGPGQGPLWSIPNPTTYSLLPTPYYLLPTPQLFATLVVLFIACQPMFAFITTSVANEPANIAFCAIGLWLAQRYILYGPSPHWGRAVALGVTLGLISLSKMTGLSFGLVAVVAILLAAIAARKRPGAARLLWRDSLIIGLLFLAVGGWWYWRNYQLYGDFFQRGLYKLYFNVEQQPLTLSEFLYTLSTGEVSFWATFGWLNIVAPEWVYSVYRIISRVGLLGVAIAFFIQVSEEAKRRGGEWRMANRRFTPHASVRSLPLGCLLLHLLFPLALAFSLTRLVAVEGGLQGRQLLPALGSITIIIIGGWWMLTPDRLRLPLMALLITVLFGLAAWLPFGVMAPEYIPKPLLTAANLPADLPRLNLVYQDEMKLIGVKIGADLVHPGERVPVTAYWQALKPMATNYSVFVHLIGRSYQNVGQFNTYPGLGLRPTRTLEPGQIVADTYHVLVEGGAAAPTRLLVNIGLFDFNEPGRPGIQAIAPDGQPATSTVGQLKLAPVEWPPIPTGPPIAEFNDNIRLSNYSIENCDTQTAACQITFEWLALAKPSTDYTVFIQLWRNGEKVAGFDAQPLSGDYPTNLWAKNELILDPHPLNLSTVPPGQYQILAGLYNFNTGDRLPAKAEGTILPDSAVNLGTVQIK